MLVPQKSQTGSGPDIFSWMNVMLSKDSVKRNMLTTTNKLCLFTFRYLPNQGEERGQRYVHLQAFTEAPNRNVQYSHRHNCPNALEMSEWGGVDCSCDQLCQFSSKCLLLAPCFAEESIRNFCNQCLIQILTFQGGLG